MGLLLHDHFCGAFVFVSVGIKRTNSFALAMKKSPSDGEGYLQGKAEQSYRITGWGRWGPTITFHVDLCASGVACKGEKSLLSIVRIDGSEDVTFILFQFFMSHLTGGSDYATIGTLTQTSVLIDMDCDLDGKEVKNVQGRW